MYDGMCKTHPKCVLNQVQTIHIPSFNPNTTLAHPLSHAKQNKATPPLPGHTPGLGAPLERRREDPTSILTSRKAPQDRHSAARLNSSRKVVSEKQIRETKRYVVPIFLIDGLTKFLLSETPDRRIPY